MIEFATAIGVVVLVCLFLFMVVLVIGVVYETFNTVIKFYNSKILREKESRLNAMSLDIKRMKKRIASLGGGKHYINNPEDHY